MMKKNVSTAATVAKDTIDRLNTSLPLRLCAADIENTPEFIRLLSSLSQQLTPDGITRSLQEELEESEASLRHEKLSWLTASLLHHELQELVIDNQLQALEITPSSSQAQFQKLLQESLSLSEASDYIHCNPDPNTDTTLFNLTKADIKIHNQHRKHVSSMQQTLIPKIEDRLRKKCDNLVSFHDTSSSQDNEKLVFAKASQLPTYVETEVRHIETERQQLKQDKLNRDKHFWMYYKALMESLEVLEELISKYRLQTQQENDTINCEWLVARCDCMYLKIKLLEAQVLCETYNQQTVEALSKVRHHLDSALQDETQHLSRSDQQLHTYEAVGMGFDSIVTDYAKLKDEIENKKWALNAFDTKYK